MFDQFPKSKFVVQKRALERRQVFMDHLDNLNKYLNEKNKKMEKFTEDRIKTEVKRKR